MNAPWGHLGSPSVGLERAEPRSRAGGGVSHERKTRVFLCAPFGAGFCQAVDQCRGGRNLSNLADERAHRRGLRGETTIAELLKHGDFGLGTFNHLDGELIAFDQEIHQLRADGSARPAGLQQKTPSPSSPFSSPASASNSTGQSPRRSCTSASTSRSPRRTCFARCGSTASSATWKPVPCRVRNGLTAQCWKR